MVMLRGHTSPVHGGGKRRCAIRPPIGLALSMPHAPHHREIGIGEAALQLPRNDPLNEDAALLKRQAVGGCPDGP